MRFYSRENKTHFNKKGFALGLVLRVFGTSKWPLFGHLNLFSGNKKK